MSSLDMGAPWWYTVVMTDIHVRGVDPVAWRELRAAAVKRGLTIADMLAEMTVRCFCGQGNCPGPLDYQWHEKELYPHRHVTDTGALEAEQEDRAYQIGRVAKMRGLDVKAANVELARKLGWQSRRDFDDALLDECERGWHSLEPMRREQSDE
jgi:hypothetical protein